MVNFTRRTFLALIVEQASDLLEVIAPQLSYAGRILNYGII
tara:strand:- start:177 stop:299 length:123 start_codon:yes stop_codon:yes gene_type:complete